MKIANGKMEISSLGLRVAVTLALFIFALMPAVSYAQCLPGIPCITDKTDNDPEDDSDGPNADGAPNAAKAGGSAACDADFMNQIHAKSFLQTQRENILAQTMIRKPDSVLEYTCFDKLASRVAKMGSGSVGGQPFFTESTRWQGAQISIGGGLANTTTTSPGTIQAVPQRTINVYMGATRLDTSIQNLIFAALNAYIDNNFAHDFLGGVIQGQDNDISTSITSGEYNCNFMNTIFTTYARCQNFGIDDAFPSFSFTSLVGTDPRQRPEACEPQETNIDNDMINLSINLNGQYANLETFETFADKLDPASCGEPIPTGIMVRRRTRSVVLSQGGNVDETAVDLYEDKVCSNPSCFYDPGNGGGGSCEP